MNPLKTANFGLECPNIQNGGVNWYVPVTKHMQLVQLDLDIAFMPTAVPTRGGYAEILCQVALMHSAPTFTADKAAYLNVAQNVDFGNFTANNPNGYTVVNTGCMTGGVFSSIILKAWIDTSGINSATNRHETLPLNFEAPAGSFLVVHMDHMGTAEIGSLLSSDPISVDVEMQGTFSYRLLP